MPVVGVTGTDGKTSTTHLLSSILETRGRFEFGDPERTVIEGSVFKACNPIS